ncbi:DUF443 family protein [Staphylococcus sp.]|uniref:DUF443 family protein n=3 Tax=Staphylococcus TaxID=1279 RepID=UPI000ED1D360|nr:DUF443 family protein [Staphylococcus sp.]HCG74269.1 hypothetical protein [Staphylococcus sp.]
MWVIIDNITIETIKKNSKYKLIHYRDSHYIIDLNQNKLTYIFPLLNYVTRKSLVEVKEKDLNDIKTIFTSKEEKEKRDSLTILASGISGFIAITTKSITDYLEFTTNMYINVFILLLTILPTLAFKNIFDNKKKKLMIRSTEVQAYAFVLPSKKYIFQNIFLYTFFIYMFIISVAGVLTLKHTNIFLVVGIIITFMVILFQNLVLYAQTTIHGKIGRIKIKK